jgi:hypothetical protein
MVSARQGVSIASCAGFGRHDHSGDFGDRSLRLIHTADWQIGKVFRFVDDATMSLLQEARLEAIATIGGLAQGHGAETVLVAGDLYDHDGLGDRTLFQPIERMRAQAALTWHLIPGNHDADRQNGIWERVGRHGLPDNVHLHLEPTPCPLGQHAWLLPAPLRRRQTLADPTAWMDDAATPEGAIRVGLAHGSVTHFGSADRSQGNYIDPARPRLARLDYLALGDWHAQRAIGPHCWYAGTPEPDDFDQEDGAVLLVDIAAAGATPTVQPLASAHYHWSRQRETLHGCARCGPIQPACWSIWWSRAPWRSPTGRCSPSASTARCGQLYAICASTTANSTSRPRRTISTRSPKQASCAMLRRG